MIKEYNFDEFESASKEDWLLKLNQDFDDKASKRLMRWDSERNLSLMTYYDQNQINKSKNAIGQFYGHHKDGNTFKKLAVANQT